MQDIMLDIETMGTSSNAAIFSIGACYFDITTGEIGRTFERLIDLRSSEHFGHIDADTVMFWMRQSDEARAKLNEIEGGGIKQVLSHFANFLGDSGNLTVWGNGCGFDNVVLRNALQATETDCDMPFWNDRDVRTIVDLGRRILDFDPKHDMEFEGVKHSALADAIHQAKYVSAIYQKLTD